MTLCPMINPACPNDLCQLPAGHAHAERGWHLLETDAGMQHLDSFPMLAPGSTRAELEAAGEDAQLHPEHWFTPPTHVHPLVFSDQAPQ